MRVRFINQMRAFGVVLSAFAVPCAALFSPLEAQRGTSQPAVAPFSAVYFAAGTMLVDVSRLNPHFERADLPTAEKPGYFTLSNDGYSLGLGGYGEIMPRVVLGGEWNTADMGQESSPTGMTNQLTTRFALGTIGYAAFTTWRVNFIPFLGLGFGSATLSLMDREGGPSPSPADKPTFDDVVMSPGTQSSMKGSYVLVQPGLAIDFLVLRETTSRVGMTLGLRLATLVSPNRTTWKYAGDEVFGGPDLGPSGGVFRLVAGVGGFRLGGR
jgi:hypothetical protein